MVVEKVRDRRRAQILDAATAIVGEKGYFGFGIQELAQRCGLTKAGLLHHFPSKDALLIAVLRNRDRENEQVVGMRAGCDGPIDGDLAMARRALRAIVGRSVEQPELVRLYVMLRGEALNPAHPAHAYFEAREAAAIELFTQMLVGGVAHPRSVARQLHALMTGLEVQWLREAQGFDLVAEWDRAMASLLPR